MKNVLEINEGDRPWQPNSSVQTGEVLDRYDVPRTGLLHDNGKTYLFTVILGDGLADSLWAYTAISSAELQELLTLHDPDAFDEGVETLTMNRCVTVAYASDYQLRVWETFDAGLEGFDGLVDRFQKRLDTRTRDTQAANEQVKHLIPA